MADEKRSLSAALQITPEVQDFIQRGDDAKKLTKKPRIEQSQAREKSKPTKIRVVSEQGRGGQEKQTKIRPEQKPKAVEAPQQASLSQARVAITTRFRQEIADSLRRASLERKLRGETPYSQQDIIESAVALWLRTEEKTPEKDIGR